MNDRHFIIVKPDKAGEYRWIRYGGNGEEVSGSSEGYGSKAYAVEQAQRLNPGVDDVRVEE